MRNVGTTTVLLDGYYLRRTASTYPLHGQHHLAPGQSVTVRMGTERSDCATTQFWGQSSTASQRREGHRPTSVQHDVLISDVRWLRPTRSGLVGARVVDRVVQQVARERLDREHAIRHSRRPGPSHLRSTADRRDRENGLRVARGRRRRPPGPATGSPSSIAVASWSQFANCGSSSSRSGPNAIVRKGEHVAHVARVLQRRPDRPARVGRPNVRRVRQRDRQRSDIA